MDDSDSDQRLAHITDPPQFLTLEKLNKLTGINYHKVLYVLKQAIITPRSRFDNTLYAYTLTLP